MPTSILTILAFALGASAAAQTFSDNNGPTQATYISDEEVKTVLKGAPPAVDQQLKVVDTGKYNVGVGIIHRGKIPAINNRGKTIFCFMASDTECFH